MPTDLRVKRISAGDSLSNHIDGDLYSHGRHLAEEYRPGEIIECLTHTCDGSVVEGVSGFYTFQNVTSTQVLDNTYAEVLGSAIYYLPPPGTTRVLYSYHAGMNWLVEHAITHHKFFIDASEVVYARHSRSGRYPEDKSIFEWVIAIGGSANTNTGRVATWTTPKKLAMQARAYASGANNRSFNVTNYWDGAGGAYLIQPSLKIMAIA